MVLDMHGISAGRSVPLPNERTSLVDSKISSFLHTASNSARTSEIPGREATIKPSMAQAANTLSGCLSACRFASKIENICNGGIGPAIDKQLESIVSEGVKVAHTGTTFNNAAALHSPPGTLPEEDDNWSFLTEEKTPSISDTTEHSPFYSEEIVDYSSVATTQPGGNVRYKDIHLEDRLQKIDWARFSDKKIAFCATHEIGLTPGFIKTDIRTKSGEYAGLFANVFSPREWIFKENYRESAAGTDFFANDIVRRQFSLVSKAGGFEKSRPERIIRKHVVNYQTIKETSGLKSGSPEMLAAFMERTPNGRSTARILEDFGLRAVRVERLNQAGVDFYVDVEPKDSMAALAWKSAVARITESRRGTSGTALNSPNGVETG